MSIKSKAEFYRSMGKYREEAELFSSPQTKRIKALREELQTTQEHFHTHKKKLNAAQKRMKEMASEIKHLTYDNDNMKEEIKSLHRKADEMKSELTMVRKSYAESINAAKPKY
ncbi:MAG TPA: hypothetical protein VJ111_16820 [Chitinophagaceae bacterium]|nr:hypothetical protein [Chitinophagaceae bacterium]